METKRTDMNKEHEILNTPAEAPELAGEPLEMGDIAAFQKAFGAEPRYRLALNAVAKNPVTSVAMNRRAVVRTNHTFSHLVKAGAATSQNQSGRAGCSPGLNLFRQAAARQMNLDDFELSQSYLFFWDKLERANYFLESILNTLDEPTDGVSVAWLMQHPVQDGGQWDMFINLVKKYGVVPKEVMPETESSSAVAPDERPADQQTARIRRPAPAGAPGGESPDALRARKADMLAEVYRMLAIHLGEPPTEFAWQWRDKDKEFHRAGTLTPQDFFRRYVNLDLTTWSA
jgi:bleomycin hydrolase